MNSPPLNGLILAGGRSSRMGSDKATLNIHGQPQLEWTAALLSPYCKQVFVSARADQLESSIGSSLPVIHDLSENSGPLAGILAALEHDPGFAWLVIACDMPWLDTQTLEQLLTNRDPAAMASAFVGDKGPEPLCAIWEPGCRGALLTAWQKGQRSPTRLLDQMVVKRLVPVNPRALISVNTPELLELALVDFG